MDEQIQDRYDELADQNEIGICHHVYHLLPEKGGEQEAWPPPTGRDQPPPEQRLGVL